jgi:Sap, sulfolipid-1-addressing protein
MLAQAAGFALLAAISPVALFVASAYLASGNPRRASLFYLAGAAVMTVIMGIVVLVILHAGGFNQPRQRQPRYGLRLGLGVLALGAALFVARRRPKPAKKGQQQDKGLIWRMVGRPGPLAAFLVGVVVFGPSVNFVAAMQVIATSRASAALTAVAMSLVVIITVMSVWLPLVCHLVAPDRTTLALRTVEAWLHVHGRVLLVIALAGAGIVLVISGIVGLA